MESLSKRERSLRWLKENNLELSCIHCQESLSLSEGGLLCPNNHRFDMAKQGYFYLTTAKTDSKYDQELFEARRKIIKDSPLYRPLHHYLKAYLEEHYTKGQKLTILDAGSGEGSHLWQLHEEVDLDLSLLGVDLAKPAIQYASTYNGYILSLVADLAKLPIQDQQCDIILSILSPANYMEFDRVLKEGGKIIKVVPNSGYLGEIRQAMVDLGLADLRPYSNEDVIQSFYKHYPQAETANIQAQADLSSDEMRQLIRMTPLTWQLDNDQLEQLFQHLGSKITLDLSLLHAK